MRELIAGRHTVRQDLWIYVSRAGDWHLDMPVLLWDEIEIPLHLEDDPLADYPQEAIDRNMKRFLDSAMLCQVIKNAELQDSQLSEIDFFEAVTHYYNFDGFKDFTPGGSS